MDVDGAALDEGTTAAAGGLAGSGTLTMDPGRTEVPLEIALSLSMVSV